VLPWFVLIHVTALVGLILFPLPNWRVLLGSFCLVWLGGMATTVCYHRAIARDSASRPAAQSVAVVDTYFLCGI
jgi:hypothetical protein